MTDFNPSYLVNSVVYSLAGIVMFAFFFALANRLLPYDLWKEIVEKQNSALAILVGTISLGVCIIIAASVH